MILAVDIGNTVINFGILKGKQILKVFKTTTKSSQKQLNVLLSKLREYNFKEAIICSVVPKASKVVQSSITKRLGVKPLLIGKDIKVPIKNKYHNPRQVGQDRLVGAYAAKCLYGSPLIIIDFGTAITFDVVNKKGEYEGGIIVPGIRLSAESLFKKTALLPRIDKIKVPSYLVGKDTRGSILSGIFYGYGAMSCGLIDMISKDIKGRPKVIVTGGHTQLMRKFITKKIYKIEKDLVFKGMSLLLNEIK